MKQLVYFLMFGLVFTVLQVTTVEAMHDQGHVDEMRATEDSERQTMRETEDRTRQTMRETEDSTRQAARDQEDRERQAAEEAMNTAAGAGGHDCSHHPTEAARTACEAGQKGAHNDGHHPPPCPAGTTCEGMDHHVMMDPRTNPPVPFSPADEAIYQPYADECESNGGTISEGSMGILITPPHNFTRLQVERLCQESVHTPGAGGVDCNDPTNATMAECTAP